MDSQTTALLVGWFFLCLLLDSMGAMGVANWAHAGGGALGVLLGWSLSRPADQRGWRWFAFPLASMACLLFPLLRTPFPVTHSQATRLFGQGTLKVQEGQEALRQGNPTQALTHFQEAESILRASLQTIPLPPTYFNLSIALTAQGKHTEAEAMRSKALELDPTLGTPDAP